jgi:hypothetical protein
MRLLFSFLDLANALAERYLFPALTAINDCLKLPVTLSFHPLSYLIQTY